MLGVALVELYSATLRELAGILARERRLQVVQAELPAGRDLGGLGPRELVGEDEPASVLLRLELEAQEL